MLAIQRGRRLVVSFAMSQEDHGIDTKRLDSNQSEVTLVSIYPEVLRMDASNAACTVTAR